MTGINILNGHAILPGADKAEPLHLHIEDGKIASVGKAALIAEQIGRQRPNHCARHNRFRGCSKPTSQPFVSAASRGRR